VFLMWPADQDASWHLLRPLAEAIYGGGQSNETYRAAERMKAAATKTGT
jgi:hypothetical protein